MQFSYVIIALTSLVSFANAEFLQSDLDELRTLGVDLNTGFFQDTKRCPCCGPRNLRSGNTYCTCGCL